MVQVYHVSLKTELPLLFIQNKLFGANNFMFDKTNTPERIDPHYQCLGLVPVPGTRHSERQSEGLAKSLLHEFKNSLILRIASPRRVRSTAFAGARGSTKIRVCLCESRGICLLSEGCGKWLHFSLHRSYRAQKERHWSFKASVQFLTQCLSGSLQTLADASTEHNLGSKQDPRNGFF